MIVVTGSVTAREDSVHKARRLSLEHVHRSRKEQGCISHSVHIDCENPLRLVFIEQWANRAALAAHFAMPASRDLVRALQPPVAASPTIQIYGNKGGRALNRKTHSWIATSISYCNAT